MSSQTINPVKRIRGTLAVPGDKSISHRVLIGMGLAEGSALVTGLLQSEDVGRTRSIMEKLGVPITEEGEALRIEGVGVNGLKAPVAPLYCGNSGTTLRLMTGLLAAQDFDSELTGDASLDQRPMDRVIEPLRQMGAEITEVRDEKRVIRISGRSLQGTHYQSPVASAQVKSALLLAGLRAADPVTIEEPYPSRDHTERLLQCLGATLEARPGYAKLIPPVRLKSQDITVPRDFSSAAFFIIAALVTPGSSVRLPAVLMNPTRSGLLDVLREMGGQIRIENKREQGGETVADIIAEASSLKACECPPELIPSLIDEIPILAVAASAAEGVSRIWGAEELRVKETDRLKALTTELSKLKARVNERPDGLIIEGPTPFKGGSVSSHGDHRMAMALTVAAGISKGPVSIDDYDCVSISYPNFLKDWHQVTS